MADSQNRLISRILGVFFERFFAENNSNVLVEWNRLISRIFVVFSSGFLHRTTLLFLIAERFLACFWHF